MASLTRAAPKLTGPAYKDYVNFLEHYKNGKKEEHLENENSVNQNFSNNYVDRYKNMHKEESYNISRSLSNSTTTSNSSISSDVTDFSKKTCIPYNAYLENSKNKKFNSVKPAMEEKSTKRSEIFIEIYPAKSVSEVSKVFEPKQERHSTPKSNKINSKINVFEKQISTENKPKLAEKPVVSANRLPPKSLTPPPKVVSPVPVIEIERKIFPLPPKPVSPPPKIEAPCCDNVNAFVPPPPPPPPMNVPVKINQQINRSPPPTAPVTAKQQISSANGGPKMQATLTKGPQTIYSVNNSNGITPNEIDRNDPMVRKLVYGTLRGLYGAYHNKANDIVATLPRNMVVKNNGVQNIIDKMASNGDLEKLNGRTNPKLEQE